MPLQMMSDTFRIPNLEDKVAVVTGASRGIGRGIALVLGEAAATVYVTGRSMRGSTTENLAGSIDETMEAANARGGLVIQVRCDHTVDADVEALFRRVREEQGGLDLLVNNVWGGYEQYEFDRFTMPFWEQPLLHWHGMFEAGLRAHLVASRLAAPLMIAESSGLIVNTVAWDRDLYLGQSLLRLCEICNNPHGLWHGQGASASWRSRPGIGSRICKNGAGDGRPCPAALPLG
jgi:NAD(P)-dependent dehydrogenase (short-subunit alcohol dehydrogenase family)